MHIAESLRLNALRDPEKTAVVSDSGRISYRQLNARVNRLANAFSGLGYVSGDKVALILHNGAEYLESFAGLTKVGLVPVPINHRLRDSDILAILVNSDSVAAVVDSDFLARIMSLRHDLRSIVVVNGDPAVRGVLHYEKMLGDAASAEPSDRSRMSSTIMMPSSGTTGLPKGILRSRYGFPERAIQQGFQPSHRMLCVMPLFFSMGAACALLGMYLGETMIFLRKFDAEETVRIIEREKIDATAWVVTMLSDVIQVLTTQKRDTGSLKLLLTSGPLSDEAKSEGFRLFGPIIQNYFGSSETGPTNFMGPADLMKKAEPNCVGKVFFGNEVVLLDDFGEEAPIGTIGKICCRGPATYDSYYNDPIGTAETRCGEYVTVGDMGRFDDEGYLYFEGRSQDMIKTGGMNVLAQEVEGALAAHPCIKEVCVIGIPDSRWIEAIKAIVVVNEGMALSQQDVIAFGKEKLSSFKAPKSVEFVGALPRNLMGKVLKSELRKRFSQ